MRRTLSILGIWALLVGAQAAHGFEVRESWPISIGGRLQSEVRVDRGSAPLSWDFTSRAPTDRTRLMLDLGAGTERYGMLYLKGDGTWRLSEGAEEHVPFSFNQGDYLWGRAGETWSFDGRAFANERRYFTGEHGGVVLYDDRVDQYEAFWGARLDGDASAFRWSLLGSGLEDGADGTRGIGYGRAGWEGNHVQASASYLYDSPARDTLGTHHIAKAELAGFFRRATAVVSYETSSFDGISDDRYGWGSWDGGNYSEVMPENSATFAELRLAGVPAPGRSPRARGSTSSIANTRSTAGWCTVAIVSRSLVARTANGWRVAQGRSLPITWTRSCAVLWAGGGALSKATAMRVSSTPGFGATCASSPAGSTQWGCGALAGTSRSATAPRCG